MAQASTPQTALVTGASSGIGCELARVLAENGHDLVLVARNRAQLASHADLLREEHGVRVEVCAKDLSVHTAPDELRAELDRKGIRVDILVNSAGFAMQGSFAEGDVATLLEMVQVNITSLTHLTRLFLPRMIERGQGRILNVSSIAAFMPGPLMAAYFASKAYVLSLSEALANELQGTGVTVTALCPGPTRTRFAQRAGITDTKAFRGSVMDAADVAQIGYDAMMKGKSVVIAGLKNKMQLLPTSLVPRRVLAHFARQYNQSPAVPHSSHDAADSWPTTESPEPSPIRH